MSWGYVAIAVVSALFLLYAFFSMSTESFVTQERCSRSLRKLRNLYDRRWSISERGWAARERARNKKFKHCEILVRNLDECEEYRAQLRLRKIEDDRTFKWMCPMARYRNLLNKKEDVHRIQDMTIA